MKNGMGIYQKALALLGEGGESCRTVWQERAVPLINLLLAELAELDCALRGEPFPADGTILQITSLEENLGYTETILYSVMPLGLAGYLLNEEEPSRSDFYLQLYHKEREVLRSRLRRGRRHPIRRKV